jgi:hypothetical protein
MFVRMVTALLLQVLDDDDDDDDDDDKGSRAAMDTDSPLPTRAPPRHRQLLDDDSDGDFELVPALTASPNRATGPDESVTVLGAP